MVGRGRVDRHRGQRGESERITALLAAPPGDVETGWLPERRELTVVLTQLVPANPGAGTHIRIRPFVTAQALADEQIAGEVRLFHAQLHRAPAALRVADAPMLPQGESPHAAVVRLVALAEGLAHQVLLGPHSAQEAEAQARAAAAQLHPWGGVNGCPPGGRRAWHGGWRCWGSSR